MGPRPARSWRVDVYPRNATSPAARVAFRQIIFAVPDAGQFAFNPPPGTRVTEDDRADIVGPHPVVGAGWTSVVRTRLPAVDGRGLRPLDAVVAAPPKVSGAWGSGHLFTGPLLSVLFTPDGAVYAGAVSPARLYEAVDV